MFYTPFFDVTWSFFEVWCLIFHTKSTENTDKKRLVRRVGMGEINVNNAMILSTNHLFRNTD